MEAEPTLDRLFCFCRKGYSSTLWVLQRTDATWTLCWELRSSFGWDHVWGSLILHWTPSPLCDDTFILRREWRAQKWAGILLNRTTFFLDYGHWMMDEACWECCRATLQSSPFYVHIFLLTTYSVSGTNKQIEFWNSSFFIYCIIDTATKIGLLEEKQVVKKSSYYQDYWNLQEDGWFSPENIHLCKACFQYCSNKEKKPFPSKKMAQQLGFERNQAEETWKHKRRK